MQPHPRRYRPRRVTPRAESCTSDRVRAHEWRVTNERGVVLLLASHEGGGEGDLRVRTIQPPMGVVLAGRARRKTPLSLFVRARSLCNWSDRHSCVLSHSARRPRDSVSMSRVTSRPQDSFASDREGSRERGGEGETSRARAAVTVCIVVSAFSRTNSFSATFVSESSRISVRSIPDVKLSLRIVIAEMKFGIPSSFQ